MFMETSAKSGNNIELVSGHDLCICHDPVAPMQTVIQYICTVYNVQLINYQF